MSHQTGIQANDELKTYFAKCRDGQIRLLKVVIHDEQLTLGTCMKQSSTWEEDYDSFILPQIEKNDPCYVLYRFDSWNASGYDWLLISWVPDSATVRQKMLYASTKATLKTEFGSALISEEMHCTILSDISLDGYKKHKRTADAPAPLTSREEEMQEIRKSEVRTDVSVDSKHQTAPKVLFPIAQPVKDAINHLISGKIDYIQMKIDLAEESVELDSMDKIAADSLAKKIPTDSARYHLYKYCHSHEGDYLESIFFIYSMPGYNCPIKERMLYSACKQSFTNLLPSWGVEIAKKLEIDDPSELTEKQLYEELHPIKNLHQPKFSKPKGPPNRGPRRLTKPTD